MEGFYLTLFDEITDSQILSHDDNSEQNISVLEESNDSIQKIDEILYSSLFEGAEPLSSNNMITTPMILKCPTESSILLTNTPPPLHNDEESIKKNVALQYKRRAEYIQLHTNEPDELEEDIFQIPSLQMTSHNVEYNIISKMWSLIISFNLPIGDINTNYPRELEQPLYVQPTPHLKDSETLHWDLKSAYQLQVTGNFEEFVLYSLSIPPNSVKSRIIIQNELPLPSQSNDSNIEVLFSVNQQLKIFPYTNVQLFPQSIFAIEFPDKINLESLFNNLQCLNQNDEQIKLELSSFEEFTKQYPYYFPSRFFPQSSDIFPQITSGDLSWNKFAPNEKMIYFKAVNPLTEQSNITFVINGDSFNEDDRVIGPYGIISNHIISLNSEECIEFSIPFPIAETIERSVKLLSESVKIDPHLDGKWFAANHFSFIFNIYHPLKSIRFQMRFKDQLNSLQGVSYHLNLNYSQEISLIRTNFGEYSSHDFPTRPQLYFEFDQLVDTESFVQAVIISKPSSDPVPVILLNDDEITCPTIPIARKEGYYVCVTIAKSDQIHPYLDPSTYYYINIKEFKSLEGPNPSSRNFFQNNFTTCSYFTVRVNENNFEFNHPLSVAKVIAEITPPPLQPVYLELNPSFFLPNTKYNIRILEETRSDYFEFVNNPETYSFVGNMNDIVRHIVPENHQFINRQYVPSNFQIIFQFSYPTGFQLIAPYLRLEFDDLELSQKKFKISEVPSGQVIQFLRVQAQIFPELNVVLQITPELPPSCKFSIVFDKIACKEGELLGEGKRFDFQVAPDLIPITWFTSFNEPYQIVFNQPLFVPGVGDLNNLLLKSDTSKIDTFEYINPYYCPTINNIYGYWRYVKSHKFAELYGGINQQDQLLKVRENVCDAMEFVPSTPFKENRYYDITIPAIKTRGYICSLKQDFRFRVQGTLPSIISCYPGSYVQQLSPTPIFLLKFNCNVDPNLVTSLCTIEWGNADCNNNDNNIVDEGARLRLASEDEIKRFINAKDISEINYSQEREYKSERKKWVALISQTANFASNNGTLVISSGPVSQKNVPHFEGAYNLSFSLQPLFEYLSFEPPKSISIRLSSMISLDDDFLTLSFSQILEPVQREYPTITPEIKGLWVVEQSTLVFKPEDLWRQSTIYYIHVPRRIKSISGHLLTKRKKIKLDNGAPIPFLKSPHQSGEINRNQVFLIRYAQPINIQSVISKSYIEVGKSILSKKIIAVREATEEEYANTFDPLKNENRIRGQSIEVLLTPVKILPINTQIRLVIGSGVKVFDRGGSSTDSYHWSFKTKDNFHIDKIFIDNPFIFNQSECIIQLSQNIKGRLKDNLPLLMWNITDLRINLKSVINNQITFSVSVAEGSFITGDLHLIVDCSNIVSDDDQLLNSKDDNFMINIMAEPFICGLRSMHDRILVLNNPFNKSYSYSAISFNFKELRVIIYQLSENNIVKWVRESPEKFLENFIEQFGERILFDKPIPVDNFIANQYVVFTIDIKKLLGKLPKNRVVGLIITPSSRAFHPNSGAAPSIRAVVQFSRIGLDLFNHQSYAVIRASYLTRKRDIPKKVDIKVYNSQTGELMQQDTTDPNGVAKFSFDPSLASHAYVTFRDLVIIATYKNMYTIICHRYVHKKQKSRFFTFTDKPQYLPGETIYGVGYLQNSDSTLKNLKLERLKCLLKDRAIFDTPVDVEIHDYSFTFKIILDKNIVYSSPYLYFKQLSSSEGHHTYLPIAELCDKKIDLKVNSNRIYRKNNLNSPDTSYLPTNLEAIITKNDKTLKEGNLTWKIVAKYALSNTMLFSRVHEWNNFKFGADYSRKEEIIFSEERRSEILNGESFLSIQFNGSPEYYFPILIEASVEDSKINFPLLPSPYLIGLYSSSPQFLSLQDIILEIIVIDINSCELLETDVTLIVKYSSNNGDIVDEQTFDLRTSTLQAVIQQIGYNNKEISGVISLLKVIAISDHEGYRSFTEFQITPHQNEAAQNIIKKVRVVTNQKTKFSHPATNQTKLKIITESNNNQFFGPITISQSQENAVKTFNGFTLTITPSYFTISPLLSFSEYNTIIGEDHYPQSMIHTIIAGSKKYFPNNIKDNQFSQLIPAVWTGSVEVNVHDSQFTVSITPNDIIIDPGVNVNICINVKDQYSGNSVEDADISLFVVREEASWDPSDFVKIVQDIIFTFKTSFTDKEEILNLNSNRTLINVDDLGSMIEKRRSELDFVQIAQEFHRFPASNGIYSDDRIVTPEILYFDLIDKDYAFSDEKSKLSGYQAFIIVYSVVDDNSLDSRVMNVLDWIIDRFSEVPIPAILVGYCPIMNGRRRITYEQGLNIANKYGIPFIEIKGKDKNEEREMMKSTYQIIYERLLLVMKIKFQSKCWIGMICHRIEAKHLREYLGVGFNQGEILVESFQKKIFAPQNKDVIYILPKIDKPPNVSKEYGIESKIRRNFQEFNFYAHLKCKKGKAQTSITLEEKGKYKIFVIANTCKQYGWATASISVHSFVQHRFIHAKFLSISDQSEFNIELENRSDHTLDLIIGIRSMNDAIALENNHLGFSVQMEAKKKKIIKTNIKAKEEGIGSLQIFFKYKSSIYSESFLISIPVNQPTSFLQNQIYCSIPETETILENKFIIPNREDNYGYLEIIFGDEILVPILLLTRKYINNHFYHSLENISSILILLTNCLQSQEDQIKIWETLSIREISKEDWFSKMIKLLDDRLNREMDNQSIAFELPHTLLALSNLSPYIESEHQVDNNNWIKSTKKQLFDRLSNYISDNDRPITVEGKVIKCYSIFAVFFTSPSLASVKIAIQFIQSHSHFSEIPIECFGWLLPVIYRASDALPLHLFSPLVRNIILEILSYLEHCLVKLEDGRSSFINSYDSSSQTLVYQTSLRSDVVIFNGLIKSFGPQNTLADQLYSSIFNNNNVNYINIQEASWISIAFNSLQSTTTNQKLPNLSLSINDTILLENNTENFKRMKVSFDSINSLDNEHHLLLRKEEGCKGKFCYFLSAKFLPKILGETEISNRGMSITRSYHSRTYSDNQFQINKMERVEVSLNISVELEEINHIRIIDHFPASFQFIGLNKQNNDWIDNEHERADGIDLFVSQLKRGDYQYKYYAKALIAGTFLALPSSVHLVYQPHIFSYSSFNHIVVI